MSCTVMYQPYSMASYTPSSSSYDRTIADKSKLYKFPHVPSPPDSSSNSTGGSPSSGNYSIGNSANHSTTSSSSLSSSAATAATGVGPTSTPSNFTLPLIPPSAALTPGPAGPFNYHHSHHPHAHHHHHPHHHHHSTAAHSSFNVHPYQHQQHPHHQLSLSLSPHETSPSSQRSSSSSRRSATPCATVTCATSTATSNNAINIGQQDNESRGLTLPHTMTSASATSASTSHHHQVHEHQRQGSSSSSSIASASQSSSSTAHNNNARHIASSNVGSSIGQSTSQAECNTRAQYLTPNCIVYESYDGDSAREVDDHFSKALSATYGSGSTTTSVEKPTVKSTPMSTRNFPPSFWNSAYQRPKLTSYGAADFYSGTGAMDYSSALSVPGLHHHHHQSDPWHYPFASHHHHHHQSYHHHHHRAAAAADLAAAYTPMPSTSRFNPAQYSSFLFPSTAAAAASASRFSGIGSGVKGDTGHWGAGGRYHAHESSWSDFHLADYSAAAAAHYSNITAATGNF